MQTDYNAPCGSKEKQDEICGYFETLNACAILVFLNVV